MGGCLLLTVHHRFGGFEAMRVLAAEGEVVGKEIAPKKG
jgi:hypothetical protein